MPGTVCISSNLRCHSLQYASLFLIPLKKKEKATNYLYDAMDNQMYSDSGEAKWGKMSVIELIKCGYKPPINFLIG